MGIPSARSTRMRTVASAGTRRRRERAPAAPPAPRMTASMAPCHPPASTCSTRRPARITPRARVSDMACGRPARRIPMGRRRVTYDALGRMVSTTLPGETSGVDHDGDKLQLCELSRDGSESTMRRSGCHAAAEQHDNRDHAEFLRRLWAPGRDARARTQQPGRDPVCAI